MVFHFVSLGLGDEKDITVRGLEIVKSCARVYLEAYTAILCTGVEGGVERLEAFYGRPVILADRRMVEQRSDEILANADVEDVALLVVGDAFAATTHHDFYLRACEKGIKVNIVHNASIMNAVACCGLQLYMFGQTISIPYFDGEWRPDSYYDKLGANSNIGLHTLCLLDIKVKEQNKDNLSKGIEVYEPPRFMTIGESIQQLLEIEEARGLGYCKPDTWAIGLSRVGHDSKQVVSGTLSELLDIDFGGPLHSLVICAPQIQEFEEDTFFHFHWDVENRTKRHDAWRDAKEAARMAEIDKRRKEENARRQAALALKKEKAARRKQGLPSSDEESDESSD